MHSQIYSGLSLIFVILRNFRAAGKNGFLFSPGGWEWIFLSDRSKKGTVRPLFRSKNDENRACVTKKYFSPYSGRKYHFRSRLRNANVVFSARVWSYTQEVYYAPREEKTWSVHISCKLPPEPKASVANTRCGSANFTPVKRILFFTIPGPKILHSRFWAGRECGTFGQGMVKNRIRNMGITLYLLYQGLTIIISFFIANNIFLFDFIIDTWIKKF